MLILNLKDVKKEHLGLVGSKAVALASLLNAGFPVPPAFVLTTEAFINFVSFNKLGDHINSAHAAGNDMETLRKKSVLLQEIINNSRLPGEMEKAVREAYGLLCAGLEVKDVGSTTLDLIMAGRGDLGVAVRPSVPIADEGRTSFAGCLQASLNVTGTARLAVAIKKCWASAFSASAIFYRQRMNVGVEAPAVIVQMMVNSEKAGDLLTSVPFSGNPEVLVESSWGLGEAVTGGHVVPDQYTADRASGDVKESRIGAKRWIFTRDHLQGGTARRAVASDRISAATLSDAEVKKLCELAMKVEDHCGRPQDIEWAAERSRLYILQSRPVTSVPAQEAGEREPIVSGFAASPGRVTGQPVICAGEDQLLDNGSIIVTKQAGMETLPRMAASSATVSDTGGVLCNAAKAAREMKIPFITGAADATVKLAGISIVEVVASSGAVYHVQAKMEMADEPAAWTGSFMEEEIIRQTPETSTQPEPPAPPKRCAIDEAKTADWDSVTVTGVMMEIESGPPESDCGACGAIIRKLPHAAGISVTIEESHEMAMQMMATGMEQISGTFKYKAVWYMPGNFPTDEFGQEPGLMGWHGIRKSLAEPGIFRCELEALRRVREKGAANMGLLLPFVSSVEEVKKVKAMGVAAKIGVSIDTPAAALEIEALCAEGISLAALDLSTLSQLVLGADVKDRKTASVMRWPPEAALRLAKHVVKTCRKHGIETAVYGTNMGPETLQKAVEMGVNYVTAGPAELAGMRAEVARLEKKILLEKVRASEDLDDEKTEMP